MKESYTVTIEKRHCEGREYSSNFYCPLCIAIREQIPTFNLRSVGGGYLRDKNNQIYHFDNRNDFGWNITTNRKVLSGRIKSHTVVFSREIPEVQVSDTTEADSSREAGKLKEIIRYVSVPESIKEKELILN